MQKNRRSGIDPPPYHYPLGIARSPENIEKYQIKEALNLLKGIDVDLMDLKEVVNALSSVESSLNSICSHPAFSGANDA